MPKCFYAGRINLTVLTQHPCLHNPHSSLQGCQQQHLLRVRATCYCCCV
jgi:hypothetical protein